MTLIFLSHLVWGSPETSRYPGCSDRSDVSMVAEPNEPKCGDRYEGGTTPVDWTWFLCKTTNTCIHEDARLELFPFDNLDFTLSKD